MSEITHQVLLNAEHERIAREARERIQQLIARAAVRRVETEDGTSTEATP